MTNQNRLSRNDFLKLGGTAALSLALSACNTAEPTATPTPIPSTATAPPPHPPQVMIPASEQLKLPSSIVDQEYRIFVALPDSYTKNPDLRYPVLYILDANALWGMTTEIMRIFNLLRVIRDVIVVGIGYPVDTFLATAGFRQRDCTPTEIPGWYDANMKPGFVGAPDDAGTGGAAKFLQFIRDELIPTIDTTYRTVPGDNGIVGHSITGLFALYALLNGNDIFKRYMIGSPSIWWDNNVILDEVKIFAANKADVTARVFMSVGAEEGLMVNDMKKVFELLHQNISPQFHVISQVFEGEIHPSVVPAHISRGIREVYGGG